MFENSLELSCGQSVYGCQEKMGKTFDSRCPISSFFQVTNTFRFIFQLCKF